MLREKLIKLAYENPELRSELLPILKKEAALDQEQLGKHLEVALAKLRSTIGDLQGVLEIIDSMDYVESQDIRDLNALTDLLNRKAKFWNKRWKGYYHG